MSANCETNAHSIASMYGSLQDEHKSITNKLEFMTSVIDELNGGMETFTRKIKLLKLQNRYLSHSNMLLDAKLRSVEQRIYEIEQMQLEEHLDISSALHLGQEELRKIIKDLTEKLAIVDRLVKTVKNLNPRTNRMQGSNANPQAMEGARPRLSTVGTQTLGLGYDSNTWAASCSDGANCASNESAPQAN